MSYDEKAAVFTWMQQNPCLRKSEHCRTSNINAINNNNKKKGRRGSVEGFVNALHCLEKYKMLFFDPYIRAALPVAIGLSLYLLFPFI